MLFVLEEILSWSKLVTQPCLEEDSMRVTSVAYSVVLLKVLFNGFFFL